MLFAHEWGTITNFYKYVLEYCEISYVHPPKLSQHQHKQRWKVGMGDVKKIAIISLVYHQSLKFILTKTHSTIQIINNNLTKLQQLVYNFRYWARYFIYRYELQCGHDGHYLGIKQKTLERIASSKWFVYHRDGLRQGTMIFYLAWNT